MFARFVTRSRVSLNFDIASSNPTIRPFSSPKSRNATAIESTVKTVRVGLRQRPAHRSGRYFTSSVDDEFVEVFEPQAAARMRSGVVRTIAEQTLGARRQRSHERGRVVQRARFFRHEPTDDETDVHGESPTILC